MKRIAVFLMMVLMVSTVEARTQYDFFGTNKKKKLEFANRVISEVLTPEEFQGKVRVTELVQAEGDHTTIEEAFSGHFRKNGTRFTYDLEDMKDEKNLPSQQKLLEICKERASRYFIHDYKIIRNFIEPSYDNYKFQIISEKNKDIQGLLIRKI